MDYSDLVNLHDVESIFYKYNVPTEMLKGDFCIKPDGYLYKTDGDISEKVILVNEDSVQKIHYSNCKNCGAVLNSNRCDYCGTEVNIYECGIF